MPIYCSKKLSDTNSDCRKIMQTKDIIGIKTVTFWYLIKSLISLGFEIYLLFLGKYLSDSSKTC